MIAIDNTLISDEVLEKRFVCDLNACKGACCVEGESGAPLEADELGVLETIYEKVKPYMTPKGISAIEAQGKWVVDSDGDFTTPLIGDEGACAYVFFDEKGIAKCAIEKAHREGMVDFPKPVSCHLYPIRLQKLRDSVAVNYHRWPICEPACQCGSALDVRVFRFLREPLIRKFGSEWYAQLEAAFAYTEGQKNH